MRTYLISDHHFGHENIYKFKDKDGNYIRNLSSDDSKWKPRCSEEGDQLLIWQHNKIVKPGDRVHFMGDVAIPRKALKLLTRLNGKLSLVKGNHDPFDIKDYLKYFDKIMGSIKLGNTMLTHWPIHPTSIPAWAEVGVCHGHIHEKLVMLTNGHPDPRYINCCVEQTNGEPIDLEQILKGRYNPAKGYYENIPPETRRKMKREI